MSPPPGQDRLHPPPEGPLDPGLQSERTALSWVRTALSMAAAAALVVRTGLNDRIPELTVAGAVIALAAVAVGLAGWRRFDVIVRRIVNGRPPVTRITVGLPTLAVVFAAVVVLYAVSRGPHH